MNIQWPSEITFKFICDDKPISNLLACILLLSTSKNKFTIGHFTTDENGQIQITHEAMIRKIEDIIINYPMDYSGSIVDCIGVEVVVETTDAIMDRLNRGREFYPDKANEIKRLAKECANGRYTGKRIVYKKPIGFELIELKVAK